MYRKYEVEVEAMSISYWVTRVVKDVAEDFLDCHIQSLLQDAEEYVVFALLSISALGNSKGLIGCL